MPFFTDASVLVRACAAQAIILGSADPVLAHRIDGSCAVDEIGTVVLIYRSIIEG